MNSQNDEQIQGGYQDKENFDKSPYQSRILPILRGIITAYNSILSKDYSDIENLEDKITGRLLLDFLEDDDFRAKVELLEYRFVSEPATYDDDFNQTGYVDIKVMVNHKINGFYTTKADYIIECKRLDGRKDLNRKYITNGICRFVNELYTKRNIHKVSAMLGFVVRKTEISEIIAQINQIAIDERIEVNAIQPLDLHPVSDSFDYSYRSIHKTVSGKEAEIYHLMLDFSSKIKPK